MKRYRHLLGPALFGFSVTGAFFSATPDAYACGSAVGEAVDEDRDVITRAQSALDDGEYREARQLAGRASSEYAQRARWIRAMSFVRDENASEANLQSAVTTLRAIAANRGATDIVSRVDLGEALSRVRGGDAEARSILEPLAKDDLIGSPHAYARLARSGGSSLGVRLTAFHRCREMVSSEATGYSPDRDLCTSGFTREARVDEREYNSPREAFAAEWGPRLFSMLTFLGISGIVTATAVMVARRRRRAEEWALAE